VREVISATLQQELVSADLVITVGGLGPTSDDVTRPTVAAVLGCPLEPDPAVLSHIEAFLNRRNIRVPSCSLRIQAMVPRGAAALLNANGTAPGLWCSGEWGTVVMLPGPPRELIPMFETQVLPRIRELGPPAVTRCSVKVCGIPESVVAEQAEALAAEFPEVQPAYCARPSEVEVRFSGPPESEPVVRVLADRLRRALGHAALPEGVESVAEALGLLLLEAGLTVATAESCTGGGIAAALTDIPGSSRYVRGGMVTYANEWKQACLGVRPETLARHGAVSRETAEEMLLGLLRNTDADVGITVTGIAGPDGGSPDKPVGLVYVATGTGNDIQVERYLFPGNRATVRSRTVTLALNQARLQLLHARDDEALGP
jgi:nicotinamide-nucleotide amidase